MASARSARGVDLNRWLEENGYLVRRRRPARRGASGRRRLVANRAFAIGLAGIFINLKDKYAQGIVDPGDEADRLRERDRRAARGAGRSGDRRTAPSSGSTSPASSTAGPTRTTRPT